MTIQAVRLNHAVLFVSDLERSLEFWTGAFGMEVVAREPRANAAFLRLPRSGNHHDLGLFGIGAGAPPRQRGTVGLYHLAWQVDTIEEIEQAQLTLAERGALTGQSSHGATKSVYGVDPDGNEFEVMWMLPREAWGEYENAAPTTRLDLAAELAQWSGVGTAGRLQPGSVDATA
jgi:catechol-2,3-dioxygenase